MDTEFTSIVLNLHKPANYFVPGTSLLERWQRIRAELADICNILGPEKSTPLIASIQSVSQIMPKVYFNDPIDSEIWEDCKARIMEIVKMANGLGALRNLKPFALFAVACESDAEVVKMLLAQCGMDPKKAIPNEGRFPLNFASRGGKIDVVKVLLENGADVNGSAGTENTPKTWPLLEACSEGHFKLAQFLLQAGSKVQDLSYLHQPQPLHYVVLNTSKEAHNLGSELLALRAKYDTTLTVANFSTIYTPLLAAMHAKNTKMITALVSLFGNDAVPHLPWTPKAKSAPTDGEIMISVQNIADDWPAPPLQFHASTPAHTFYTIIWHKFGCPLLELQWNGTVIFPGTQTLQEMGFSANETIYWSRVKVLSPLEASDFLGIQLICEWKPAVHNMFPKPVRDCVVCWLLVCKRLRLGFDNALIYKILHYACFGWLQIPEPNDGFRHKYLQQEYKKRKRESKKVKKEL